MKLYTPPTNSHWYSQAGEPMHDADLRVARKMNLLPSVTTVQRAAAKPALDSWKMTQAVLAALTLPRLDGEPDDVFAKRVVTDSGREAQDAADWGTRMHEVCALSLAMCNDEGMRTEMEHAAFRYNLDNHAKAFDKWRYENVSVLVSSEIVVTHRAGYAGRLDARVMLASLVGGGHAVIDFKGRGVKDGKVAWYPEQVQQLAAYRAAAVDCGLGEPTDKLISVIIDRNEPVIYAKVWTEEEARQGERQFMALLAYWQEINKYWPNQQVAA